MPYNAKKPPEYLIKKIRKRHPKAPMSEIRKFIHVFNSSKENGESEGRAFAKAWGVINNSSKLKSSHRKTKPKETIKKVKKYEKKASKDIIPGGLADDLSPEDFDRDNLDKGIESELEHTSSKDIAEEIAMDHLTEDPGYYQKLEIMEKGSALIELANNLDKIGCHNGADYVEDLVRKLYGY